MNKQRRKALEEIVRQLENARSDAESVKDEEQEAFDNLPESIQGGERGQKMEEHISTLEECDGELQDLIDKLNEVVRS